MADNIYALLTQAWAVAKSSDSNIYGVEIAIVTNVCDPEKQGRVKICFPRLPGAPESDWARVCQPAAGPGRGFYWLPEVNDEVLVAFERGQANHPFVIGALWNGKDKPMQDAPTDDNTVRMIQTRSGHKLVFDDKPGEEKLVIGDKSGNRTLTFDVKAKKLLIEAKEGDVSLQSTHKMALVCEDLEIKTAKTAKIEIGTKFDLKVAQKASIKSGPQMNLKADKVQLNPSSLSVEGIARAVASALARGAGAAGAGGTGGASQSSGGAGAGPAGVSARQGGDLSADAGGGAQARSEQDSQAAGDTKRSARAGDEKTTDAAASQSVGPGQVRVQLVSIDGKPQASQEFELIAPDGRKHAGKTGSDGSFEVKDLPQSGACTLDLPDVKPAPQAAPAVAGRTRFVEGGVKVKIGAATVVEVPPRSRRLSLSGMHFDTNKTFLRPEAMVGIRQLVKLFNSFDGLQALVNGHTDRQLKPGFTPEVNRALSVERSDSIKAFLLDDVEAWQKFYAGTPHSAKWGTTEDQLMLATIKDQDGAVFYAGPIDGKTTPATKDAIRRFQEFSNGDRSRRLLPPLAVDGVAGGETREELVRAYMALEGTSLPRGSQVETHGCGQTHPLPGTENDPDPDQPKNRRVEVFLFEGAIDPKPLQRCPPEGCPQHAEWVKRMVLDVDLDQPPGSLSVKVAGEDGAPVPNAHVHVSGPLVLDATTGADGVAVGADGKPPFDEIIPQTYKVVADADGFLAADQVVAVAAGAPAQVTLTLPRETFSLDVLVEDKSKPPNKLEKATVTIDAPGTQPQTTGADGLAHFQKLPRGTFKLTAVHERFDPGSISVDIPFQAKAPAAKNSLVSAPRDAGPSAPPGPVVALNASTVQISILIFPGVPDAVSSGAPEFKNPQLVLGDGTKAARRAPLTFALSLAQGTHTLKVDPDPSELSRDVAGVDTGRPIATTLQYQNEPQYLLRPFEVEIEIDATGLKRAAVKAPQPGKPPHASVSEAKGTSLKLDWRPDWFKRVLQFDGSGAKTTRDTVFFRRLKRRENPAENLIDLVVFHQTFAGTVQSSVRTLAIDQTRGVAAHYVFCPDGHVIKLVHESLEAVHGDGFWQFDTGFALNNRSIGFEIVHSDFGLSKPTPFTPEQYASLVRVVQEIQGRFGDITGARMIGHSDITKNPEKENDPGPMFQWRKLERFVRKRNRAANVQRPIYGIAADTATLNKSDAAAVRELQEDLAAIGYLILRGQAPSKPELGDPPGTFGGDTGIIVKRFQRRFMSYDPDDGDPPAASWPTDDAKRVEEFGKIKSRFSGTVDLKTAEAIKQVLADGPPAIRRFRTRDGKPPFARPGQSLELTWFLEGDVRSVRIEPGGIDALPLTRNGRGTTTVQALEKDAVNGVVTFIISLVPAAPVKLGIRAGEQDAPQAPAPAGGGATSASIQVPITHNIPPRDPAKALTGTDFMRELATKNLDAARIDAREAAVLEQMKAGSIPDFMRNFIAVDCPQFNGHSGTIFVSPDYLAVGTDSDFIRFPLKPRLAQQVQDLFDTTFPTHKIVDILIGDGNAKKVALPEQVAEATNASYVKHNQRIEDILKQDGTPVKRDRLLVGHKKDIILSPLLLNPAPADLNLPAPHGSAAVVIYGAIKGDKQGNPTSSIVQPESDVHAFFYEDYSHGTRLVSKNMIVDGAPAKLFDILHDRDKFGLVAGAFDAKFPTRYPSPAPPPPRVDKVKSSRIVVGNKSFVAFYNQDLLTADRALAANEQVYVGSLGHTGAVMHGIGSIINEAKFKDLFDNHLQDLTGKPEITINEFLAYFFIIMNEVGGGFTPADEHNKDFVAGKAVETLPGVVDDAYFFEARGRTHEDSADKIDGKAVTRVGPKSSYNLIGLKAGEQLAGRTPGKPVVLSATPVISSQADIDAWNRTDRYPHDQPLPVRQAARECDFFKLRGRGLNQVTGRANYEGTVNPVLRRLKGKTFDELTEQELSQAFKDPAIYVNVSKNFFQKFQGAAMTKATSDPPDFHPVGLLQAGSTATDYAELFHQRCVRALNAILQAGFTTS